MKKIGTLIALLAMLWLLATVQAQELRGTWMARSSFTSKAKIAAQMDSLASANFNVVYVNVWSRGYPLWQSDVFKQHTGVSIDPAYAGRDILAEAIAEGHRVGLHVEAWFEYGFVGGYAPAGTTSKGPIFEAHPTWLSRTQAGVEKDGSNFYWMVQSHPDVHQFLISLSTEIARQYDVDGIEMDRIRYSSKDYGYDPFTVQLYKNEHGGSAPPSNGSDPAWMRWRADKLNQFVGLLYDSLKAVNPHLNVSSAPSQMGTSTYTAYENLLQDWQWWITNRKVDNLQMQSYSSSLATYRNWLTFTKNAVPGHYQDIYPSFAVNPGTTFLSAPQVQEFIDVNTSLGYKGASLWFYNDLEGKFKYLGQNRYAVPAHVPYAPADWREQKAVITLNNTQDAVRTGSWAASTLQGFTGNSIYSAPGNSAISYFAQVPANGFYEVYVFNVPANNRTSNATYQVFDHQGQAVEKQLDQSSAALWGWQKLGDFYLTAGRKKIVTLSAIHLETGKLVSADAVMLLRNRRLENAPAPNPLGTGSLLQGQRPSFDVHPNPAAGHFQIKLSGNSQKVTKVRLLDMAGRNVATPGEQRGMENTFWVQGVKAGVYVLQLQLGQTFLRRKIVLL